MQQIKEYLVYALGFVIAFLSPIFGIMFLVGAAILLDTATGLWKSKKTGIKITSKGLQALVAKMFFYQGVIVLLFCLDKFILNDVMALIWDKIPFAVTKTTALVLLWIEMLSINENYEAVKGVSIIDKFKKFVGMAKKIKNEISDFKSKEAEGKDNASDTVS